MLEDDALQRRSARVRDPEIVLTDGDVVRWRLGKISTGKANIAFVHTKRRARVAELFQRIQGFISIHYERVVDRPDIDPISNIENHTPCHPAGRFVNCVAE